MNFVYERGKLTPLNAKQLAREANLVNPFNCYVEEDFQGENDRVQRIACDCNGNAEFELLPPQDGVLRRSVQCRLCGAICLL